MTGTLPLAGLRVVEVAGGIPAAFCARMLRGFGAETIRAEGWSESGDQLTPDQQVFLVSGSKRVALDQREGLQALVGQADVLIEDQGPGFLARSGLDPRSLATTRPELIVTSLSPFGHSGPRARWATTNAVQYAVGGLMTLTGDPHRAPLVTGGDQAYFFGGLHAFAVTVVAALGRFRRGRGDWLDVSMQEVAASIPELYGAMSEYELKGPATRAGNSVRAVWGVYRCVDGFAGLCCLERQVPALFSLLGEPVVSDPRFADPVARAEHDDELLAHVMPFMLERTKDELVGLSPIHRVPFGAVRTPAELLDDETYRERGFFDRVDTPWGRATMPGRPFPGLGWSAPKSLAAVSDQVEWSQPRWAAQGPSWAADSPAKAPLAGVRVLDLTMMWAGPYATKLLAECGAEVIKIESPRAWDNIRTLVPQDPSIEDPWNSAYYFNEYNHSKRSLTLDLAQQAGREIMLQLVARADVVIENYRADVLDNLGLGFDVLQAANDKIVVVSMAGFGKTGSLNRHVGFGPIIEMMSGLMSLTGYGDDDVPVKTGVSYGDPVGGVNAVAAVVLALLQRDRTAAGCHIDLAQRETASTLAGPAFVAASLRGESPTHWGNRHPELAPQGCYPASGVDQWVVISVRSDAEWRALCTFIGQPELAGLTLAQRRDRHDEIDELVAAWTAQHEADAVAQQLQGAGVPAGAVIDTYAVHDDPQLTARQFYRVVPNPKMRPYRQSGPTWRFHQAPPHLMVRSPWFGEHNDEILTELGLSPADRAVLSAAGVIATAPVDPKAG